MEAGGGNLRKPGPLSQRGGESQGSELGLLGGPPPRIQMQAGGIRGTPVPCAAPDHCHLPGGGRRLAEAGSRTTLQLPSFITRPHGWRKMGVQEPWGTVVRDMGSVVRKSWV